MDRLTRAGRTASAWLLAFVLAAAVAPRAHAQFGAQINPISVLSSSPYPADWQKSNSLANMQVFNGTQEIVRADIKVTLFNRGEQVATTPNVTRIYPDGNSLVPTYDLTQWQRMDSRGRSATRST